MGFVLTWGGINRFGITATVVDQNGNVISTSNPVVNPNANSAGAGSGVGGGAGSGGAGASTIFGYNPDYVSKSKNARTATQLYYYGLLDDLQYNTAHSIIKNPKPFNQNYRSKKSTVTDDTYDEALELAVSRSANYDGGSAGYVVKAARLSSLYKPVFLGLYNNRSTLEKETATGNSILIEVTASMDFYHIPTTSELADLTYLLNASASAAAAALGVSVNTIMPSPDWHGITREPWHPNGEGNYYPYRTVDNNQSSQGVIYDIVVEPRDLNRLKPVLAVAREQFGGYWFGPLPVTTNTLLGPEDILGVRYDDGTGGPGSQIINSIQDRRDPDYLFIDTYISRTATGLYQHEMLDFLRTQNNGGRFLPSTPPNGVVDAQKRQGTQVVPTTYDWTIFMSGPGVNQSNVVEMLAPRVRVTARLNLSSATSTIFTKGTYSHVEVPKVVTTGDEYTPSVIICHDTKKIYYFIYSYQDNERSVAYNVLRECEEDDKRTYMPLPTSSIYYTQPWGIPQQQFTQSVPPPTSSVGTQGSPLTPAVLYNPNGPVFANSNGYNKFGFGTG